MTHRDQSRALIYNLYDSGHVGRPHHVDSQSPCVRQTHICAVLQSQYIKKKKKKNPQASRPDHRETPRSSGPPDGTGYRRRRARDHCPQVNRLQMASWTNKKEKEKKEKIQTKWVVNYTWAAVNIPGRPAQV